MREFREIFVACVVAGGLVAVPAGARAEDGAVKVSRAPQATAGKPAANAPAGRRTARVEGIKLLATLQPNKGFVDDAFGFDSSGTHLVMVAADASRVASAIVLDLARLQDEPRRFDLTPLTRVPTLVRPVLDGSLFVVGKAREGDKLVAAVFTRDGAVARKWGPARDITLSEIDGAWAVTLFNSKAGKKGAVAYEVSIFRLADGVPIGRKRKLVADASGFVKSLGMQLLYWKKGYSQIVGRKKGLYDRKTDQTAPDSEALYDLASAKVAQDTKIADVIAWTEAMKLRGERHNVASFVLVSEDGRGLELVGPDDRRRPIKLPLPFHLYDPATLRQETLVNGSIAFSLQVDPQNPDALAQQRSDPAAIDLYVLPTGDSTARRMARVGKDERPYRWQVAGKHWAILRKHKGFDRGGTEIELYELTGINGPGIK